VRWMNAIDVGAGVLAKAVGQAQLMCLIHRLRQQAGSHKCFALYQSASV